MFTKRAAFYTDCPAEKTLSQVRKRPDGKEEIRREGGDPPIRFRVGGARTYRGVSRYDGDLGRTLGFPVQAGPAHRSHTQPPYEPYSLGALTPPTRLE